MIIVGLTGGIGHGKTTFANLLASQAHSSRHYETWELVAEVATALRDSVQHLPAPNDMPAINRWLSILTDIIAMHLHVIVSYDSLKITERKLSKNPDHYEKLFVYLQAEQDGTIHPHDEITTETKELFRPLLQWLGGYLVIVCSNGIWYDELIRRITHERSHHYEIVTVGGVRYPADAERVRNAGGCVLEVHRPEAGDKDTKDLTERERALIKPDSLINNNGNLSELADCASLVMQDLRLRQLEESYTAQAT